MQSGDNNQSNKLPKHFCVLPWTHLVVNSNGNISPCSRFFESHILGNVKTDNFSSMWNGPLMQEFRNSMLSSEAPSACRLCNEETRLKITAYRDVENLKRGVNIENVADVKTKYLQSAPVLKSVELRFSNLCNLRCRTCSPYFSSAWYPEASLVDPQYQKTKVQQSFKDKEQLINFIENTIDHLETIQILGGEPLVQDEFYILLEKLIELKKTDVKIYITSNLTRINHKHWNFVTLLQHFSQLYITASLDGINSQSEYLRKGSDWKTVEKNITIINCFSVHRRVQFYPVISVLNCFHIVEALNYWIEKKSFNLTVPITFNYVTSPVYYSVQILNTEERARLRLHYETFLQSLKPNVCDKTYASVSTYLNGILAHMESGSKQEYRATFAEITKKLDESRKESLQELFPELSSIS